MRIVALGGCGDMGRFAVRAALRTDYVSEIIIADVDGRRAAAFAQQCGDRASHVEIDVTDTEALGGLLADADVVFNTTGPYYHLGVPVLQASIAARCHYFDLNDDWEPTLEMLDLHADAEAAGITAVVGIGASPGISNLLAVLAMRELDRVETVYTGWSIEAAQADPGEEAAAGRAGDRTGPSAASVHAFHQLTGYVRMRRRGAYVDDRPLEELRIDYPGVGVGRGWTIGHPEAVTLPRHRPEINNCWNVMVGPPWLIRAVRWLARTVDMGVVSVETAASLIDTLPSAGPPALEEWGLEEDHAAGWLPPLFAVAKGSKDGGAAAAAAHTTSAPPGGMGGATGTPLALAFTMLARGEISRRGVFAPDDVIDPDAFFDMLAPLCNPQRSGAAGLVRLTRSWEQTGQSYTI